jgi:alkanesulfonate monooxygenase SsuD/methylene tetrahydromethanopterin reductase-like flavin-dependent oxidoreductase (luciferase family)
MLRLIGHKADGWLPSIGYLKPGELAAGQAIIDEAAADAGRDPRATDGRCMFATVTYH